VRRGVLATATALVVAVLPSVASAQPEAVLRVDYSVEVNGAGFDGSVVAQPLADGSVMSLAKHGWGPGGTTTVRLINQSGAVQWVTTIAEVQGGGFYGSEYRESVALPDGRAVFVGYSDSRFLTDIQPDGHDFDAVILVVSPDGSYEHVAQFGDTGQDFLRYIVRCADGTFYVGGSAWDHSVAPSETPAIGMADNFVARFDAGFRRMWVRQFGSRNNDAIMSLGCRADGGVDVNAWAAGSVNGEGNDNYYNFFTMRMSATGETVRTIVTDLDGGEWSPQGGVTAADGSYYVVGESNSVYPSLPCTERALGGSFIAKYSADGVMEWRTVIACANMSKNVVVEADGSLLVVGTAFGKRIAGQPRFGGSDFLLHRFAPDGTRLWTRQFGTGEDDVVSSFALDTAGNAVIGGYTKANTTVDSPSDEWDALTMRLATGEAAPSGTVPCSAATSTMLSDSVTPRPIWIYGEDIGEARMAALWAYAHSHTPHDFGRLIAADQDWLGACRYAGIGLGTGSGYSWLDRNVVLWVWADAVDIALARRTVMDLIDSLVPTPVTTLPPTTTTVAMPALVAPDETVAAPAPGPMPEPPAAPGAATMALAPSVPGLSVGPVQPAIATGREQSRVTSTPRKKITKTRKPAPRRRPAARAARGLGVQRG